MLSIFTLSALGAFGVTNALTDVTDRSAEDDPMDDGLDGAAGDAHADGLGGDGDLIADLDIFAAPEEAAAAEPEDVEVIAVSVGMPGLTAPASPAAAEAGFRTALGPGDELTLNIAPDLPGQILAVHAVYDMLPGDEAAHLASSFNFYMMPEGQVLPAGPITGPEAGFIEAHGLQKLGMVEMGRIEAHVDARTGEVIVTEDTRQDAPPKVVANRSVTEIGGLFS